MDAGWFKAALHDVESPCVYANVTVNDSSYLICRIHTSGMQGYPKRAQIEHEAGVSSISYRSFERAVEVKPTKFAKTNNFG
jgi:hypothetical protein